MGTAPDYVRSKFGPIKDKNLKNVVAHQIAQQFPRIGGERIQQLCAQMIFEVLEEHLKPRESLHHGQVIWMAVHRDHPPGRHQRIADSTLVPVVLDLSTPDDVDARIQRESAKDRLARRARRLCQQAYEQDGLLSNCDLAEMLCTSDATVADALSRYEDQNDVVVPRRANLHDVGSGLTHKRIICWKHYAEGKQPAQVARETYHALESVDRYIAAYDRVRKCRLEGMTPNKTAHVLQCTVSLVKQYLEIDQILTDRVSGDPQASAEAGEQTIPWLDFAYIRDQITIEQVMRHVGAWDAFRPVQSDPNQYRGPCPIHASKSTEKKQAQTFSVNTDRNLFQCFDDGCKVSGNVLELWKLIQGLNLRESAWDLAKTFNLEIIPAESCRTSENSTSTQQLPPPNDAANVRVDFTRHTMCLGRLSRHLFWIVHHERTKRRERRHVANCTR